MGKLCPSKSKFKGRCDMTLDNENLMRADVSDEILSQITNQPKRQFSKKEIDEARGNLALMNDRVFLVTFADNKNNHIITGLLNALRKIHDLPEIYVIERTTLQKVSLLDVVGRGMVGDLFGEGEFINLAVEVQRGKQEDYAIRGTLTSSNIMRNQLNMGNDYSTAPDTFGIHILGFRLPQLDHRKEFCSRIIRAEYESKEPFLADKYSDYYIELPKMDSVKKKDLPKQYHELWDLCCIFKAKIKDYEEVIRMNAISNPNAIDLSRVAREAVMPDDVVSDALNRKNEMEQLRDYLKRQSKKDEATGMEKMIIVALRSNAPLEVIKTMQVGAGITDARLDELKRQSQMVGSIATI